MYIYVDFINYKERSCLILFYTVSTLSRPRFESQVDENSFFLLASALVQKVRKPDTPHVKW